MLVKGYSSVVRQTKNSKYISKEEKVVHVIMSVNVFIVLISFTLVI